MNVVAREPIRGGYDNPSKHRVSHLFPKPLKSWTTELRSALAIIAKDVFLLPWPSLGFMIVPQTVELLFDCLCLCGSWTHSVCLLALLRRKVLNPWNSHVERGKVVELAKGLADGR